MAEIRVSIITYRRINLLRRALNSLLLQTYRYWKAEVINDDPFDESVLELIKEIGDERISLSLPLTKRGGTKNFNYCYRKQEEPYACILEDDNWYEPEFFETMLKALESQPNIQLAVANERIWKEQSNGSWIFTEKTIWSQTEGTSIFEYSPSDKCGSAKICNSSMFWRTQNAEDWKTPDEIPIDVTEHFRERVIPHPILLVHQPLVNYAETLKSYRTNDTYTWGSFQVLLICSVFSQLEKEKRGILAKFLWDTCTSYPRAATLIFSGLTTSSSRHLLVYAPFKIWVRFILTFFGRINSSLKIISAPRRLKNAWLFLNKA